MLLTHQRTWGQDAAGQPSSHRSMRTAVQLVGPVEGRKKAEGRHAFGGEEVTTCDLQEGLCGQGPASASHPALVVAGAGIQRHASAHKRSPLFHRRAPALSIADLEGSPRGSLLSAAWGPLRAHARRRWHRPKWKMEEPREGALRRLKGFRRTAEGRSAHEHPNQKSGCACWLSRPSA